MLVPLEVVRQFHSQVLIMLYVLLVFPAELVSLALKIPFWVICIAKHLLTLKLICHFVTQSVSASRSFCRMVQSPADLISLYMIQSSANSLVVKLTQDGRSRCKQLDLQNIGFYTREFF